MTLIYNTCAIQAHGTAFEGENHDFPIDNPSSRKVNSVYARLFTLII